MKISHLTPESFSPYGAVIPSDNSDGRAFDIKLIEPSAPGWRIAVLAVENRTTGELHCHPETMEVFELLSGSAILIVAPPEAPAELQAFYLDHAVCVNKNVWHSTITISQRSLVRITENAAVTKRTHPIAEIGVALVDMSPA